MHMEIDEDTTPAQVAAYAITQLPKETSLVYISYDDQLMADQVQKIFVSRTAMYEVADEIDENFYDHRDESAETIIKEIVGDEAYELIDEDEDDKRTVMDAIYERDTSDTLRDLKRNTHDMLIRYRLCSDWSDFPVRPPDNSDGKYDAEIEGRKRAAACGIPYEAEAIDSFSDAERQLDTDARKLAAIVGIKYLPHRDELRELIINASYGGSPEIIWYGSATDLMKHLVVADDDENWATSGYLTFENPHLLVIDNLNGSGHDVCLKGATVTVPFDPTMIVIDEAKNNGYGWDNIAGVYKPAYRTHVTFTPEEHEPEPIVTQDEIRFLVAA
jgi:hypothetical protein